MTLRKGPQALDAERLGRAAEAVHLALLQSDPPAPGEDSILHLFPAWPREWNARFTLLTRGGFLVASSIKNGTIDSVELCRKRELPASYAIRGRMLRFNSFVTRPRPSLCHGGLVNFRTAQNERLVPKPKRA